MSRALNAIPVMATAQTDPLRKLKVLWLACPDYTLGIAHGGNLRLFNYGRELVSQGHEVYLVVRNRPTDDEERKRRCLDELKRAQIITDFLEIEYHHPRLRGKLGHLLFHPALTNRVLRKQQAPVIEEIQKIIARLQINVCICSARDLLFVLPKLKHEIRTVVDWVDSYFLYHAREARLRLSQFRPGQLFNALRMLAEAFVQERYYGRRCDANLTVSPVDKRYQDFANGEPARNQFVLNGVAPQRVNGIAKVKGQLIFTGNMDFPPNYESAIWFIDHVFPLVRERCDVSLVIAGANPVKELADRAGDFIEITGYKENLRQEIAASELYIAPLICGGGFKNKVVEAITSGTYLVATSMAVEFLGARMRNLLLVADTPRQMADAILTYLQAPEHFDARLKVLKGLVDEELSWTNKSKEFVAVLGISKPRSNAARTERASS